MDLRFQLPIHLHIRTTLINITTTDAYGRTDVDVYTFIIDDEVTSTPTLATTGTQTIINGSTYLGANGRITLDNLVDAGGVGVDYAECFWDDGTKHTGEYPFHNSNKHRYCRPNHSIHTQLSNRGPSRKHRKQHNHLRICRSPNSNNNDPADGWKHHHGTSTISFATTDANLNGTSTATITWTNTTSSWNTTVAYNGTWNGSIAGLNSNLGDGSVSVSIITRDWFGNQQTVNQADGPSIPPWFEQPSVWIQATLMSTMSATTLATLSDLSQRRLQEARLP